MKKLLPGGIMLVVALTVGAPATLSGQDEAVVRATLTEFHEALEAGDSVRAIAQLAPEVRVLEGGGVETLEEYRSHHLPGDMAFAEAVPAQRGEMHVRMEGDVAWAYTTSVREGTFRDREISSRGAELAVLRRIEGEWKIVAIHWSSGRR